MPLLKAGRVVPDPYTDASGLDELPPAGPVIVSLSQWQDHRATLLARAEPVGVRLSNDQDPALLREDLPRLALVALEFPKFRDGRAYSQARLLRERYEFRGELRAVGDVLQEQLGFMARCGFDSFLMTADDPAAGWATVTGERSVWYQATGDGRPRAMDLRAAGAAAGAAVGAAPAAIPGTDSQR